LRLGNAIIPLGVRTASSGGRHPAGSFGKEGTLGANSGFPKHKELFTEGYYRGEQSAEDADQQFFDENLSSPLNQRFEEMNEKYKRDAIRYNDHGYEMTNVQGGILKNYKKIAGQTVEEVLEGDYWQAKRDIQIEAAQYFNNVMKDEKDMMTNTKNYTMRHRLNREVNHSEDFRKRFMTREYGNYEKYDKNRVKTEYKEEEEATSKDKFYDNYLNMIRRLPTKEKEEMREWKREGIEDLLTTQAFAHQEFPEKYARWSEQRTPSGIDEERLDEELNLAEDPENYEGTYCGRMSPFSKEMLFREYQKGMTIKDLSLKYGILQQRVKAIIYQKFLYWNEVYPRLGETHMRLAIEREALYAAEYPFLEYGQDLDVMAELEKGCHSTMLTRTEYDTDPHKNPKQKEEVNAYLEKMRSRKSDRIPRELLGSGPDAYLLQDWVCHRGKGAPRVSQEFKEIARHYGRTTEHFIKTRTRRRMDAGGLRYASLGAKWSS